MIKQVLPLSILILWGCQTNREQVEQVLFNGKDLTGWDTFLGPAYDGSKRAFDTLTIPGLNNDPDKIFSIAMIDGQSALRISGEHFGGISTQQEFTNYHLKLEFKWGFKKSAPKDSSKRDSGLLYHAIGNHGADYGFWMRSQEFQIQEGDCGDYWGVAGGVMDIPAIGDSVGKFVYDPKASLVNFSGTSVNGRRCIKGTDAEKRSGEWNRVELYCLGDTAIHIVNDKVVMKLYNSRQAVNGIEKPLTKGKIQLQSEGAEIFYRNITVEPILTLPPF